MSDEEEELFPHLLFYNLKENERLVATVQVTDIPEVDPDRYFVNIRSQDPDFLTDKAKILTTISGLHNIISMLNDRFKMIDELEGLLDND